MKKTYIILTAMLAFVFAALTPAQAQEPITFTIGQSTGFWTDWNNNPSNQWAKKWESTSENPHITIHQASNANNMRFWDGENITFYNSVGGSTDQEDYEFIVSTGWYIVGMSVDFTCSNDKGVSVALGGEEAVENWSTEEFEHVEISDIEVQQLNMTIATLTPGNTTFANTKNLVLTLAKQSGLEVAEAEFMDILRKYQNYEEDEFQVGTAPGLFDAAARDAFFAAVEAGHGIEDIPVDELTEAKYKELGDNIVNAYDALVASRNMNYQLPEGYKFFRVRAAMPYLNEDGEEVSKYLYAVRSGENFYGYWTSPDEDDALDQIQRLWVITPSVNAFDMVSAYCEGRFNNVSTSANTTISAKSDNMMAFDPVYTDEDGVTYFNIRVASQEANKYLYLHQGGHGGGNGKEGFVVGWSSTWTYIDGPKATEWVLEPVSDDEAGAIVDAGFAAIVREQFEDEYVKLSKNANNALAAAQSDMTATDLITSAEQLSSPWTEESEGSIEALIDGDPATFWHSAWSAGSVEPMTHYLQVELNEPTHDLVRIKLTRRQASNDHITAWVVAGSNDPEAADEDWTLLAALITPYGNNTETVTTRGFHTKDFKHLRLYIAETTTGRGYGHAAELQLQALTATPGSQYAAIQDEANALIAKLEEQEFIPVDEITEEQGLELQDAYDNFRKVYVDPTDLRNLIVQAEALAKGIVTGTNPGYWSNNSLGTTLSGIVARAKAYDEAAVYTAEKSNAFINELNEAMAPVLNAAIGIKTGKWYNIRFGSEATFEENGWDLVAGEAVLTDVEEGESAEVVDEALWDKIVTVATYSTSEGIHYVSPIEAEDVRLGNYIFVDDKADIDNPDMALFRFVAVGDSAYMIQNKATGLFIRTGVTGAAVLDIHPSLFNVRAIGFGQNVIEASDLSGVDNNNLHIQRSYNMLVTWDADTPGSRSGLYLDEVADVASDYKGEAFQMDIRDGEIYTFCYPVDLALGEDNAGQMWTVNKAEANSLTLARIDKAFAGRPFIYISGDTEEYDAEADPMPAPFVHGYDVAAEPNTVHALKGTYVSLTPGAGFIIVNESKRNAFVVSHAMMENSTIGAHQAYIATEGTASGEIEVTYSDEEDGIATALANISRTGAIYTIDGRLLTRNGNLNTVSRLPRGIYILNGTKVAVK